MNAAVWKGSSPAWPAAGWAGDGLLVIATDRRICARNAIAQRILRNADALVETAGRLAAVRPADDARLQVAIDSLQSTATSPPDVAPLALTLARRCGRTDYVLLLSPHAGFLDSVPRGWHPHVGPRIGVVIHDFPALPEVCTTLLQQCFALTPAQARLAALLARGVDPRRAARELGVALSTVRTHLRAIYDKTDTSGQVELARRITALASACAHLVQLDETESFTGEAAAAHEVSRSSTPIALIRDGKSRAAR